MAAAPRRRRLPGQRRRVEDEGEDDVDILDDDSLTEGSLVSDDHDAANDSDTSNVDDASPTAPDGRKITTNGITRTGRGKKSEDSKKAVMTDTEIMLNGLSLTDSAAPVEEINFDDLQQESPTKTAAPIVVSSASASIVKPSSNINVEPLFDRRRREHEEYRKKRDEDPAFVPNRGAFFMHDHRGAGPSANGFRPFNRGGGRGGRGRGGFCGHVPFAAQTHINSAADPTTSAPWSHDMHDTVVKENMPMQSPRYFQYVSHEGPANGNGVIPRRLASSEPINRTLSTEKHIGNAQVRVFFPPLKQPTVITGLAVKQYTKLPDHRPPLRRDKPVRISLPQNSPRYVYPASDRSFIFIPRAMRPNQQQRVRGKPRSVFGSVGGFSRRTSIYGGGGSYYGSVYSPSVAMSRRSSINFDMPRDHVVSPTGSTMSRPPLPIDTGRPPVVRLPPAAPLFEQQALPQGQAPQANNIGPSAPAYNGEQPVYNAEASISDLPQPQTHPLPQKPSFQESRSAQIPMHQPRPQKTVSVESIESPTLSSGNTPQSFQQAFHQQVPAQVSNNVPQERHHRRPSHPPYVSTGTPLSQIPERAIHAAPFQPNAYAQQNYYGAPQPYPMMPPQQGYYYPPPQQFAGGMPPSATAPTFVPGGQQQQPMSMTAMSHGAPQGEVGVAQQPNGQAGSNPNLITQEVNGTFYFYDASQLPAVNNYPPYGAHPYVPVGMPGMMAPSPDGFYYPQTAPGMMYYSQ